MSNAANPSSDWIPDGAPGIAEWIAIHYPDLRTRMGCRVTSDMICHWWNGRKLPAMGNGVIFPRQNLQRKTDPAQVAAWLEANLIHPTGSERTDGEQLKEIKREREMVKLETEKIALEKLRDSLDGKHILITEHQASLMRAMAVVRSRFITVVERRLPIELKRVVDNPDTGLTPLQRDTILTEMSRVWPMEVDLMQLEIARFAPPENKPPPSEEMA